MKLYHYQIPYTEINPKWIKDMNVKSETTKLLKENIGSKLLDVLLAIIFCIRHQNKCNKSKNKKLYTSN